jgi:hypothetical protein
MRAADLISLSPSAEQPPNLDDPVHLAYNPSFSACFFSWNSVFLSQQISQ